jgi:hypothetical protein
VKEYLGKMYNEYKYEIEVEQIENNLLLNETEGAYLNKIFETARKDFDFVNKKIGFLTGSSGTKKSSKEHFVILYFQSYIDKSFIVF